MTSFCLRARHGFGAASLAGATLCALMLSCASLQAQGAARPATPSPAPAASNAAATPLGVGVVDEDRLADGFTRYNNALKALEERAAALDAKMPAREYLTGEQASQFDALVVRDTPSAAEAAQIDALVRAGMGTRTEYLALVGKPERTPAETRRMDEIRTLAASNQASVRAVSETLFNAIKAQQESVDKQYTDRANAVVGQVAAEKRLAVILRKRALVWWANATDITDDVLRRLNEN